MQTVATDYNKTCLAVRPPLYCECSNWPSALQLSHQRASELNTFPQKRFDAHFFYKEAGQNNQAFSSPLQNISGLISLGLTIRARRWTCDPEFIARKRNTTISLQASSLLHDLRKPDVSVSVEFSLSVTSRHCRYNLVELTDTSHSEHQESNIAI